MNIEKQNIDDLTSVVKVKIEKNDYESLVKKSLNNYRRKAEIKGFRTGMAPASLIQKLYGRSILVEEINKLVSEALSNYITEQNLDLIGEPIPCDREQQPIDWDTQADFEFAYEVGVSSPLTLEVNGRVKVPYYNITVSNEDKQKQLEYLTRRFGEMKDVEVSEEEDTIRVDFKENKEGGIDVQSTPVWLKSIENEDDRKQFIGLKVGDTKDIDVKKIFTNDADLAAMLHIEKAHLADVSPVLTMTVSEIKRLENADVNQELFDKVYGEGNIADEAAFMQRIEEEIAKHYTSESDIRFGIDARNVLLKKAAIELPEEFLKRWLLLVGEGKYTEEDIEREFELFAENLRWQKITNKIAKEQDIKLAAEDIKGQAIAIARERFAQYGLGYLPDEHLEHYANKMLENREEVNQIAEQVMNERIVAYVKEKVKLDEKEITFEGLRELYENESKQKEENK